MKRFEGWMIFADVDGTLFQSPPMQLPQRNIEALRYFQQNGGHFTLATGRSVPNVRFVTQSVALNAPAVLANGTLVYDFETEQILQSAHLPALAYDMMCQVLEAFPGVGVKIVSGKEVWYYRYQGFCKWVAETHGIPGPERPIEPFGDVVNKLLLIGNEQELAEVRAFCQANWANHPTIDFVGSSRYIYEMLPKGYNKGSQVRQMIQSAGLDPNKVCAIGDFDNDREMLESVCHPFCPCGAPERIQNICQKVFGSAKEGILPEVIDYIEKQLIGRL